MSKSKSSLLVKGKAVFYWVVGAAIVAVIIALSFYFDNAVRDFMSQHQNRSVYDFMRNVSRVGDWSGHFLIGVAFFSFARWRGHKEWARIFLAMMIALSIAGLTGRVLKVTTGRARPSVKAEHVWNGLSVSGSKYHSFPSGHVDASVGFFAVLFLARRRIGIACLPIPMLIGFSRLYLGAHWLSDVACGAVLGILSAIIVWHFVGRRSGGSSSPSSIE